MVHPEWDGNQFDISLVRTATDIPMGDKKVSSAPLAATAPSEVNSDPFIPLHALARTTSDRPNNPREKSWWW